MFELQAEDLAAAVAGRQAGGVAPDLMALRNREVPRAAVAAAPVAADGEGAEEAGVDQAAGAQPPPVVEEPQAPPEDPAVERERRRGIRRRIAHAIARFTR